LDCGKICTVEIVGVVGPTSIVYRPRACSIMAGQEPPAQSQQKIAIQCEEMASSNASVGFLFTIRMHPTNPSAVTFANCPFSMLIIIQYLKPSFFKHYDDERVRRLHYNTNLLAYCPEYWHPTAAAFYCAWLHTVSIQNLPQTLVVGVLAH
jgi:hypothetical protein